MKEKIFTAIAFIILFGCKTTSYDINTIINATEAGRVEKKLSSDEMKGRKVFTPDIDKAAAFIAAEFKKAGLETSPGNNNYLQTFSIYTATSTGITAELNENKIDSNRLVAITTQPDITITEHSGYAIDYIKAGSTLSYQAAKFIQSGKNYIVLVDSSFSSRFSRLSRYKEAIFKTAGNVIFILSGQLPEKYTIHATHTIIEKKLSNVVGILPGTTLKNEYVIFSAHYDHLGIDKPVNNDSIYNGANDDASGTTAVITLAKYFKALHNNKRTLVFAAFTAEEIGGYGSQYFSMQMNPKDVVAMFNIEMIGTTSKWGDNAAYITGFEKTNMGAILQKNLQNTGFTFHPDPYTEQQLFYRSDNATLARLGVPAHTISTSKMDSEPNYHKSSDEIGTLDMKNMAEIIKAIAASSKSIIAGLDTPSRVDTSSLK